MKQRIKKIAGYVQLLDRDRNIDGKIFLWSFIKMYSSLYRLRQAAAALTYHTLFATVPVMAMLVAVANKMGYGPEFKEQVHELFSGNAAISEWLLTVTDSYLNNTNTSHIIGAAIGLAVLLYSVFSIFQTIDNSFNSLWNLKGHSIRKQLKVFTFSLLVPFVIITMLAIGISVSSFFGDGFIKEANVFLVTFSTIILILFVSYKFIPGTKVNTTYAAISAGVCGAVLYLAQYFGFKIFAAATNLHDIYGSLASILIFLIWIHVSWNIILAGSRWNYLLQEGKRIDNENKFRAISHSCRKFLAMLIAIRGKEAGTSTDGIILTREIAETMSERYNLPTHITVDILDEMCRRGIIIESCDEDGYIYNDRLSGCSIGELSKMLDGTGDNSYIGEIISEAHLKGKEAALWRIANGETEKESAMLQAPMEQFFD